MKTIAVLGLGNAVLPHAKSLMDLQDRVRVAHAYSRTESRRAAFAARFPFPVTGDLDAVFADPAVDAVFALTPPNTHLDIARRCAATGKHVLVEKPVELTTARAAELVAVCRGAGITLGIVLQYRFRLAGLKLKELLESGALGRIVNASAYVRWWRGQKGYYDQPGRGTLAQDGGGVLITQAIHVLDLLLHLTGPVSEVTAFAQTSPIHAIEVEDIVAAAVRYENGAIGAIDATTVCWPGFKERIEIVCEKGTAVIAGAELTVSFQDGRTLSTGAEEDTTPGGDPMSFPHDYHKRLIAAYLDALETGGPAPITGESALRVHHLIDALLASAADRRIVAPAS